jgi:hypothetical protein
MLAMITFITFYPSIGEMLVLFLKYPIISDTLWKKLNKFLKLPELGEVIIGACGVLPILGVGVVVWLFAIAFFIFLLKLPIMIIISVIPKLIWLDPDNNRILILFYTLLIKYLVLLTFLYAIALGLI